MEWTDEAVVLSLKPHGESAAILEALTRERGRHLGLVYGGASAKKRAVLQPGNRVVLHWRARLAEHLGNFTAEIAHTRAHLLFERRDGLAGLNALVAVASVAMPEREPHRPVYEGADAVLDAIADHDFVSWVPLYVRWELGVFDELGFGLDLANCAATGGSDELVYVSPKTGRAVSRDAGEPYRDRLLVLPPFLKNGGSCTPADCLAGLKLTAFFLDRWVLAPHGHALPEARVRLGDLAAKLAGESA